jgi:prolyl-tRNA editing enzyme YbaK/EbsC (Cys-tRNA(Pro) deacylase)
MLAGARAPFNEIEHEPTRTSEQSAEVRGEDLHIGGKALLLKIGDAFHLFVLSAARRLDSAAIKRHFKVRRVRFAAAEELNELTGLAPGAVPPFGRPILPFDLFVDQSIVENGRIAFNAGSLTHSIVMSVEDYLRIARPQVLGFSRSPSEEE